MSVIVLLCCVTSFMTSFISHESFDVDPVAGRQIDIPFPSFLFRVVLCMPINTCVVNYNTIVVILYSITMSIDFYMGLVAGLFLALFSIYIFTKIHNNRERQELSAALREQSQFLLALQRHSRRRYNYMELWL